MRIIGPPSVPSFFHLSNRLSNPIEFPNVHPRWMDVTNALWTAAEIYGIDPVVVIGQSAYETGWWNYSGLMKAGMFNTCGVRLHSDLFDKFDETKASKPFSHATFAGWYAGALAHVQHLCAYTGLNAIAHATVPIVDPRYELVVGLNLALENVEELGGPGRWAPNPAYGVSVANVARRLQGRTPSGPVGG